MDIKAGFLGQYISAAEFGVVPGVPREPTFAIARIMLEKVKSTKIGDDDDGDAVERDRLIVYPQGGGRGWLLNRTNAEVLAVLFQSRNTDDWIGKRVTIHAQMVRVGRTTQPGIRIKGSPDLAAPMDVTYTLPRKKPLKVTLVPTGNRPARDDMTKVRDPDAPKVIPHAPLVERITERGWLTEAEEHVQQSADKWTAEQDAIVSAWATARRAGGAA